jgi:hypothetical protein
MTHRESKPARGLTLSSLNSWLCPAIESQDGDENKLSFIGKRANSVPLIGIFRDVFTHHGPMTCLFEDRGSVICKGLCQYAIVSGIKQDS